MKHDPSDADSIPRWRDRPAGGTSDEDRAAALARDVLVPGEFFIGLDDRQLAAIGERLQGQRRARPPIWLRPAVVATLVSVSVASVMGYENGWFAPLRERLRFRSIPHAAPAPAEHAKKRAPRPPAAPTSAASPAPAEAPAPAVAPPDESAPAQAAAPVAPHTAVAKSASAPLPIRKLALADSPPPPPRPVERAEPPAASEEVQALERAISLLRGKHDGPAALAALDDYVARFPSGVLVPEARVARVDALLMLGRADEALRALETLPLDGHRRSTELQLIRGELRARTDCARAEADFTAVLARVRTAALAERALYGRAACRSAHGNTPGAADDLRRYVERFPTGAHADWARRWLENDLRDVR
jgi:TolA-binding protein